jgi:hypothetical protein
MSNFSTKIAATASVVALVATAMSASLVSAASEFLPYATLLADNSVIGTQTNESGYRLGDTITRAELAKVTANLGGYTIASCAGTTYGDVGASLGDLCGAIEALADAGVVSTANANFRPSAAVTRAEATKMLLGAVGEAGSSTDAGYMDTASLGDLAMYINRANEMGCAADATYFRPTATASRGEAFKLASCVAGLTPTTVPPTTGTGVTGTGVVAGALTVALDGAATAQYVPKNASSVKVGAVKLTAGTKDVTVRSLTVGRSGLGDATDILANQGVRAAIGGVIVSSSSDYYNSTSQNANVYFYPALVIKAGTSTSVDILVNLSGAQNSQHQFTLASVNSDATVTGAPVTLGLLNTTSYATSAVAVSGTSNYTVAPGKTQQTFAKVDLTAGNRDTMVSGFTLTRSGGTDFSRRFTNVKAYKNGVAVGTATVTVTGLNTALNAGNFQSFEVRADVLVDGSSSTNTVGLKIESSSDVAATEVATGYSTQTTGNLSFIELVTFTNVDVAYTKVSTANQTVSPGTSNVTLFNGKLTSTVPLTVRQLVITPSAGASSGALAFANDQLSVKLNGSEIATITSADFPAGSVTAIPKVVSVPVDATTPATITIVASSIKNATAVAGAYTFTVALADVRDSANNSVSLITSSLVGDKTTIQAPVLTLKNATVAAPTNSTISALSNQEVGRFGASADGDAVRVTKIVVTATGTYDALANVVSSSSIELWNADTNTKISATTTVVGNVVTFDSMTNDILKDTTQNFKVLFTSVSSLDANYGKTITFSTNTGAITTTTVNSSATVTQIGSTTMKTYTIGVVPPVVLLTAANPLDYSNRIGTVRVSNVDSNTGITLSGVSLTVGASTTLNSAVSFSGMICLRELGSNKACGGAGTTAGVAITAAGGTYTFATADLALIPNATSIMSKNTGYVDFEVYISGLTTDWRVGDFVSMKVNTINYTVGAASSTQDYSGVSGSSATAKK